MKYNKMAHDDTVLLKQAELKAKLTVAQELYDRSHSQEMLDTNRGTIEETEDEIEAMFIKDVKETLFYLDKLISQTEAKLGAAERELARLP